MTGQVGDHPREHRGPFSIGQIHTGHEHHRVGKQLDPIGRNCVAFCVADGIDPVLSRAKRRLFGSCPRHFTPAGPSMASAGCFLRDPPSQAGSRAWAGPSASPAARGRDGIRDDPLRMRPGVESRPGRSWHQQRPPGAGPLEGIHEDLPNIREDRHHAKQRRSDNANWTSAESTSCYRLASLPRVPIPGSSQTNAIAVIPFFATPSHASQSVGISGHRPVAKARVLGVTLAPLPQ